jgi:hypothetical protein
VTTNFLDFAAEARKSMHRSIVPSLCRHALVLSLTLAIGCQSGFPSFRIPPAETPRLISTGIQVTSSTAGLATIGALSPYCSNDFTAPTGVYGRGFYVAVVMPTLNRVEVTYAGIAGDYWGSLGDPSEQQLYQGPRPANPQQIQDLQGNYVGYFIHDDLLTGNEYHVVIGILLGQGTPEGGALEIRSVNGDPHNTGLQARSNPLEIRMAAPVSVTANASPATVTEGQPFTLSWNASNADRVHVTGSGAPTGALPVSGSQQLIAPCVGNRDQTSTLYQVQASRAGCPLSLSDFANLTVTVDTPRRITQFESLPRVPVAEGANIELVWNAPGATSVALSGPNGFSHNSTQSQGRVSVRAPTIPSNACAALVNSNYQIVATWPSCGTRTQQTLVSVAALTFWFDLVESGGSQCLNNHSCRVLARNLPEARQCALCPIQQGCTWR